MKDKEIYPAARSIMDYALVRRTILVNQNIIWQLDGENKTVLPIILSLQTFKQGYPTYLQLENLGKCFLACKNKKESRNDIHNLINASRI